MLENKLTSNDRYLVVGYLTRIVLVKNHQISLFKNKRKTYYVIKIISGENLQDGNSDKNYAVYSH